MIKWYPVRSSVSKPVCNGPQEITTSAAICRHPIPQITMMVAYLYDEDTIPEQQSASQVPWWEACEDGSLVGGSLVAWVRPRWCDLGVY